PVDAGDELHGDTVDGRPEAEPVVERKPRALDGEAARLRAQRLLEPLPAREREDAVEQVAVVVDAGEVRMRPQEPFDVLARRLDAIEGDFLRVSPVAAGAPAERERAVREGFD